MHPRLKWRGLMVGLHTATYMYEVRSCLGLVASKVRDLFPGDQMFWVWFGLVVCLFVCLDNIVFPEIKRMRVFSEAFIARNY